LINQILELSGKQVFFFRSIIAKVYFNEKIIIFSVFFYEQKQLHQRRSVSTPTRDNDGVKRFMEITINIMRLEREREKN
jgi:hypothetical protein